MRCGWRQGLADGGGVRRGQAALEVSQVEGHAVGAPVGALHPRSDRRAAVLGVALEVAEGGYIIFLQAALLNMDDKPTI